jgi:cysteinyl-tRNA synthetase
MKIYNTLTRQVEDFTPLNPPKVSMYTCGPTVYDFQHIGNLRTMILSDILRRTLEANDYKVKFVRNITDIDDKIIKGAAEKNLPIDQFSEEFTKAFNEDLNKLNILSADVNPKATEHIGEMIKYIEELIKKGLAYVEEDGSVYFDISEFPNYGKLSQLDKRELKTGTRILSDEYSKDNVQDFALWKAVLPDELAGYDSPWGRGRPGWHIECSVMSQQYLGETFDIHVGGMDLLFPHHENEIAQSEGKTGKPFVNFFVHGEMLLIDGGKMSKSLKNFYLLKDLEDKGIEPLALRYLFLTAHYRDSQNFTWDSIQAAQNTLNKIREEIRLFEQPKGSTGEFWQRFLSAANNDLGIPQAVGLLHELIRKHTTISSASDDLLAMDKILGLGLDEYLGKPLEIPTAVLELVEKRENVRKSGNFEESDNLRKQIKELGFEVLDTPAGPRLKR